MTDYSLTYLLLSVAAAVAGTGLLAYALQYQRQQSWQQKQAESEQTLQAEQQLREQSEQQLKQLSADIQQLQQDLKRLP